MKKTYKLTGPETDKTFTSKKEAVAFVNLWFCDFARTLKNRDKVMVFYDTEYDYLHSAREYTLREVK